MLTDTKYEFDVEAHRAQLIPLLKVILNAPGRLSSREHQQLMRRYPKPAGEGFYSLANLVDAWRAFAGQDGVAEYDEAQLYKLRRKPVRTMSGVTPLTLLTKPFPCPGTCIFCPNDVRMPKSYLADEPGAQRAEKNAFDPYLQTWVRLQTYHKSGAFRPTRSRSSSLVAPGRFIRRLIRFGSSSEYLMRCTISAMASTGAMRWSLPCARSQFSPGSRSAM